MCVCDCLGTLSCNNNNNNNNSDDDRVNNDIRGRRLHFLLLDFRRTRPNFINHFSIAGDLASIEVTLYYYYYIRPVVSGGG